MHDDLLRAALDELNLAPGAHWSKVLARYRQLAKVWHPDRFQSTTDKERAEEKLKKIIAAKELLQTHYQGEQHRPNGYCACWGSASQPLTQPSFNQAPQYNQANYESTSQSPPGPQPGPPPPPPPQSPPPPPPNTPPHSPDPPPEPEGGKGKKNQKPHSGDKRPAWDWRNELCGYLDIGPLIAGEPPWFETFRRICDRILGKHPGETVLDIWEKPPTWTKEHKRKCLLIAFFTVMLLDKIITAIDPNALKSPDQIAHPELNGSGKSTLPLSPFPDTHRPDLGPPVDFNSREEIRQEEQYFDQKWQERERMLQGIRPADQPSN